MDTSNACPTEDAIEIFLDYLVDPLLPVKYSMRGTPSLDKEKDVANQVHAVVLLYNYYHRKMHQHLKYLDFQQFCKLAVVLKPTLKSYMKYMLKTGTTELSDLEKQLSLTEKAIKDACDISISLDTSRSIPCTKEWPVSKVAVLLIDSTKGSCFFEVDSITKGVKSLIEQDVPESCCSSEGSIEAKHMYKRKRISNKHLQDELGAEDCHFQKFAFSAVKEATKGGINQSDLTIVESHVVYSLSKEKSATRFYIMQCIHAEDKIDSWTPIKDVIDSLRGPLVEKSSSKWMHSSVVEYFHMLPYAEIISHWFFRDVSPNSFQDQESIMTCINVNGSQVKEERCEPDTCSNKNRNLINDGLLKASRCTTIAESEKQNGKNEHCINDLLDNVDSPTNMDVDNHVVVSSEKKLNFKNVAEEVQYDSPLKMMNSCAESDINGMINVTKGQLEVANLKFQNVSHLKGQIVANRKATCDNMSSFQHGIPSGDHAPVIPESNYKYSAKLQKAIASKESILSETALKVLRSKRDKLVLQQRNIGDEIVQCNKKMQAILDGGKDDLLELKLDLIIEGCNDVCLKCDSQGRDPHDYEDQCSTPCIKRNRVPEEILYKMNPCQELDGMCNDNNWILPTYQVFPSDGGYQAKVTIKAMGVEHSSVGDACPKPFDARGSAAAQMLAKLHSMSSPVH